MGGQNSIVQTAPPIASGSNVRLSDGRFLHSQTAFDDDDVGMSSDEDLADLPDHLAMTLPINQPGGYGENFDQDGNFMGRGRDTFVGPKASSGEYVYFHPFK